MEEPVKNQYEDLDLDELDELEEVSGFRPVKLSFDITIFCDRTI